jgi:hypothetical protein
MKRIIVTVAALICMLGLVGFWALPVAVAVTDNPRSISDGLNIAKGVDPELPRDVKAQELLQRIILWVLGLVAVIALAVLIWGAFMYIVSVGSEEKAALARRIILYAIIGLLLVGGSFFIISTIRGLLIEGS